MFSAGVIQVRVREAEETELQINSAREEYRSPPALASLLWFIILDLPSLDPMYQYSLSYFCSLFKLCIKAAPVSSSLAARLDGLISTTTTFMYRMVSVSELLMGLVQAKCLGLQIHSWVVACKIVRELRTLWVCCWQ